MRAREEESEETGTPLRRRPKVRPLAPAESPLLLPSCPVNMCMCLFPALAPAARAAQDAAAWHCRWSWRWLSGLCCRLTQLQRTQAVHGAGESC